MKTLADFAGRGWFPPALTRILPGTSQDEPHRLNFNHGIAAPLSRGNTTFCGDAGLVSKPSALRPYGPRIDIHVTRAGVSLPIAAVPNLQPGDQIWLHPAFPANQSAHYLLIAAFLRGTTNPPPDDWFIRIETWQKRVREEGVVVTVPADAQQAVLFLAPETGGDFATLRSAVKGRPGIFVRASQDLTEAGFEQARIEKYLAEMRRVDPSNPTQLLDHSNLLARTLALKPNPDCFKRALDLQYNCLTQSGNQSLLDDGHGQSVVATFSTGPGSDLINQASYTQALGAGVYSAYVGAIVDLVRLTESIHTAKYQYIPAIAFPGDATQPDALNLRLNAAPSFNNPKSVIVISLPAVLPAVLPPLRPVDPRHISCLLDPHVVLPIEGAPLVFSTDFAHALVLHLNTLDPNGKPIPDLALTPDAFQGGLILAPPMAERHELPLDAAAAKPVAVPALGSKPAAEVAVKAVATTSAPPVPGAAITGTIQGMWGFDKFTGPTVSLQHEPAIGWHIVSTPAPTALIAGQPGHLRLQSTGTACIQSIELEPGATRLDWKLAASDSPTPALVDLTVNLQHVATPGSIHLAIQQFGQQEPDQLGTRTFAEPARIQALTLHAGDTSAILTGTSLDQVKTLTLHDQIFIPTCPGECTNPEAPLTVSLPKDAKAPAFKANEKLTAQVHLQDGRTLDVSTVVLPARPAVTILSSRASLSPTSAIQLNGAGDISLGSQLTFFLKSKANFPRTDQIEIANADESLHTTLSIASGTLVLEDSHTILATFDPLKLFGPSTFGPFRLRAVDASGTPGEWLALTTIVRLPMLTDIHCTNIPSDPCQLNGSALYLIDAVSLDPTFAASTSVPEGYVDPTLAIPHPASLAPTTTLYLRLRDDPTSTHPTTLQVQIDPPPAPTPKIRTPAAVSATTPGAPPSAHR